MTSPHTAGRTESLERASNPRRSVSLIGVRLRAADLQRKGLTFSEIAERLDLRRAHVVNLLYWEKVRDV